MRRKQERAARRGPSQGRLSGRQGARSLEPPLHTPLRCALWQPKTLHVKKENTFPEPSLPSQCEQWGCRWKRHPSVRLDQRPGQCVTSSLAIHKTPHAALTYKSHRSQFHSWHTGLGTRANMSRLRLQGHKHFIPLFVPASHGGQPVSSDTFGPHAYKPMQTQVPGLQRLLSLCFVTR